MVRGFDGLGKKSASGTVTLDTIPYRITVSGLTFLPSIIIISTSGFVKVYYQFNPTNNIVWYSSGGEITTLTSNEYVVNGSFKLSATSGNINWIAVE